MNISSGSYLLLIALFVIPMPNILNTSSPKYLVRYCAHEFIKSISLITLFLFPLILTKM